MCFIVPLSLERRGFAGVPTYISASTPLYLSSFHSLEQGSAPPQCLERVLSHLSPYVGTRQAEIKLPLLPGFEPTTPNSTTFRPIFPLLELPRAPPRHSSWGLTPIGRLVNLENPIPEPPPLKHPPSYPSSSWIIKVHHYFRLYFSSANLTFFFVS